MPSPFWLRERFEEGISRYRLDFLTDRDSVVEDRFFPPMMPIYVSMVGADVYALPPTQQAFGDQVLSYLRGVVINMQAARARAYRTYTSCVQQHHWQLVLRERFDRVFWDVSLDLDHGIDVVVAERGWRFGFSVSVQTERADFFKSRKARRYHTPPFPVLDVKIQPREYTRGRFWLASPDQAEEAQAFIDMHLAGALR